MTVSMVGIFIKSFCPPKPQPSLMCYANYEKQNKLESFTLKSIRKCYIWGTRYKRIIKITNPEDIFLEDDLTDYLNSKEALTNLKFI